MKTSCAIIQDLLPLYVDEVCSGESRDIVEKHLLECASCREKHAAMRIRDDKAKEANDMKLADGLKKLKSRVSRRMRRILACALAAVVAIVVIFELLCVQSLKTLGPEDISITAEVYAVDELPLHRVDDDEVSVSISKGEDDAGDVFSMVISDIPNAEISMTESVLDETDYITVVDISSFYHIRNMRWREGEEENTLYVNSIKTSFLKNRSEEIQTQKMLEMRKIDKIVHIADDGSETVLWQAEEQAVLPSAEGE